MYYTAAIFLLKKSSNFLVLSIYIGHFKNHGSVFVELIDQM